MRWAINSILLVLVIVLLNCKNRSEDISDISGTWYYIFKDSIYGEVILTKNILWEYSEEAGTWSSIYFFDEDSLMIKNSGFKFKLERKGKDEFTLINRRFKTHYYRLKIPIDTVGLLNDSEESLDSYVRGWRERKYNWEHSKGNS